MFWQFKQQLKVFDQSPSAQVSRAMDGELARLLERALIIQNQVVALIGLLGGVTSRREAVAVG